MNPENRTFHTVPKKKRYYGLDILKLICAFLVVYIHARIPGAFGDCVYAFARIAVPIFFMITGFFYETTLKSGKANKQLKKIFMLFVYSNVLYFLGRCLENMLAGNSIRNYLQSLVAPPELFTNS